jgi:hypothetical protein
MGAVILPAVEHRPVEPPVRLDARPARIDRQLSGHSQRLRELRDHAKTCRWHVPIFRRCVPYS